MTIVRNVLGEAACDEVGRIRLLREAESQVSTIPFSLRCWQQLKNWQTSSVGVFLRGGPRWAADNETKSLQGAAFDLPEELAKQMQENQAELTSREFALDVPKSLPLEEEQSSLRHGRASGGRGSPRGGYGSGFGGNRYIFTGKPLL